MCVHVEGQWFLLHHFEGRGRNQIRFKIPVLATTRHPDISGAQPVTQFRECAQFIEVPIHSGGAVPPETPMAPTMLPSMRSGIPPSTGTASCKPSTRRPSPPAANTSSKAFVERLKNAAECALSMATLPPPICVLSIFSK